MKIQVLQLEMNAKLHCEKKITVIIWRMSNELRCYRLETKWQKKPRMLEIKMEKHRPTALMNVCNKQDKESSWFWSGYLCQFVQFIY